MRRMMYILSFILLCLSASCSLTRSPSTPTAVESAEVEEQYTRGLDNFVEDYEYLFTDNMRTGKYVFADGAMQQLENSSEGYFSPSDIKHFVTDPQPIISIIRSGDFVIDQGIPVMIVDHFGVSQPATILFDDGSRVAIQPNNPLKDGKYFVIDDQSSASSQNMHFLDYFYIWQEKDTKSARIGEFLTGIYGDSPSNALFSYFDLVSVNSLKTPLTDVSENVAVTPLPELTEGTLAFVANLPSSTVRFVKYAVEDWNNIGISVKDDNCFISGIDDLGIQNGFQLNDEIMAVNDVPLFSTENMSACWALRDFLSNQTLGHNLNITIKRGGEMMVMENVSFNISRYDADKWLQIMDTGNEEVTAYQTSAPLLDGLYCFYEYYAEDNYKYCFWKQ